VFNSVVDQQTHACLRHTGFPDPEICIKDMGSSLLLTLYAYHYFPIGKKTVISKPLLNYPDGMVFEFHWASPAEFNPSTICRTYGAGGVNSGQ